MNQLQQETRELHETIERQQRDTENHKADVEQKRETLEGQVLAMQGGKFQHSNSVLYIFYIVFLGLLPLLG